MGLIRKNIAVLKPQIFPVGAYLFFLLILPAFVKKITPCMNFTFGVSYSPAECNTAMILDRFLILALIGFSVIVITMLVIRTRKSLVPLLTAAIAAAGLTVIAYYLYIPAADAAAANAPILLDSFRD